MSLSCQPDSSWNACDVWHVAKNFHSCNNLNTPHGPYDSVESCQVNSAGCSNGNKGIYARWALTPFVKQGRWAKGPHALPYPNSYKDSYYFNPNSNQCERGPRNSPGSYVGAHGCVATHSPYVDKMDNVF